MYTSETSTVHTRVVGHEAVRTADGSSLASLAHVREEIYFRARDAELIARMRKSNGKPEAASKPAR